MEAAARGRPSPIEKDVSENWIYDAAGRSKTAGMTIGTNSWNYNTVGNLSSQSLDVMNVLDTVSETSTARRCNGQTHIVGLESHPLE